MKKFILSLFVGFVGFFGLLNFCNAETSYTYTGSYNSNKDDKRLVAIFPAPYIKPNPSMSFNCSFTNIQGDSTIPMSIRVLYERDTGELSNTSAGSSFTLGGFNQGMTSYYRVITLGLYFNSTPGTLSFDYNCNFHSWGDDIGNYVPRCPTCPTCQVCQECQECPEINTGEILSGYILESEIDTNYCVGNGLCPNECGSGTDFSGDLQYSNIYINSILHPGKQNIFIDIPDYITWDYSSTGDDFNLYVGSGYDVDYINSIIDINSYRPSSSDFTNIFVSGLTLIFPYIFIALLLLFIWKFIKKFFK